MMTPSVFLVLPQALFSSVAPYPRNVPPHGFWGIMGPDFEQFGFIYATMIGLFVGAYVRSSQE